ncbi:MAG: OB-fold nucleic acid binding domain-containing protein [Candidatus Pacearchaeota archaeon]|nr:OB-fold nucleic acid binding domain-containing protein [Candidatus Pacearchaeota archaeon]
METKKLLKLSIVIALITIFLITILANSTEPKTRVIETITERNLDEWVKIEGTVTQVRDFETLKIITVNDKTASINCILRKKSNISEKSYVEIIGKVIDYKGELEIEISQLKIKQ